MKIKITKIVLIISILLLSNYILIRQTYGFSVDSSIIYEGIDISGWQGNIDFEEVKNYGIEIVYIKSSEGFSFIDPYFEQNYTKAKNNFLYVGVYHYVTAKNVEEAIQQANFFVSVIENKTIDCKLAMDFENFDNLSRTEINQIASAFMKTVERLSKKEVVLYSNTYSARCIFSRNLTIYPLWVAQYEVAFPTSNGKWNSWIGWQYTSSGSVPGISGNVDRDKFTKEIFLRDTSKIVINNQNTDDIERNTNYSNRIVVKWGDTLSQIAFKYNTTVSELAELNDIENPNVIYVGETIILPTKETNKEISDNKNIISRQEEKTYIVQKGDTLTKIAKMYGTEVYAIALENNIYNINLIYVGQKLKISSNTVKYNIYKIQKGDTLWSISRRYGVSIATIVRLNRIKNPNLIYAGNYLKI